LDWYALLFLFYDLCLCMKRQFLFTFVGLRSRDLRFISSINKYFLSFCATYPSRLKLKTLCIYLSYFGFGFILWCKVILDRLIVLCTLLLCHMLRSWTFGYCSLYLWLYLSYSYVTCYVFYQRCYNFRVLIWSHLVTLFVFY
jgi:hypothetical protein